MLRQRDRAAVAAASRALRPDLVLLRVRPARNAEPVRRSVGCRPVPRAAGPGARLIDEAQIYGYCLHPLSLRIRSALFARKTGRLAAREARLEPDGPSSVVVSYFRLPDQQGAEVITVDGTVRRAREITDRPVEYYGEVFLIERSLRIEVAGTLMMFVDGDAVSLSTSPDGTARGFVGIARRHWRRTTTRSPDVCRSTPAGARSLVRAPRPASSGRCRRGARTAIHR